MSEMRGGAFDVLRNIPLHPRAIFLVLITIKGNYTIGVNPIPWKRGVRERGSYDQRRKGQRRCTKRIDRGGRREERSCAVLGQGGSWGGEREGERVPNHRRRTPRGCPRKKFFICRARVERNQFRAGGEKETRKAEMKGGSGRYCG